MIYVIFIIIAIKFYKKSRKHYFRNAPLIVNYKTFLILQIIYLPPEFKVKSRWNLPLQGTLLLGDISTISSLS
jgi:hypothetical protein